jgi:hypothetical protein
MARRSADSELNDWLDRHGYQHARTKKVKTPHPYVVSSRMAHATRHDDNDDDDNDDDDDDLEDDHDHGVCLLIGVCSAGRPLSSAIGHARKIESPATGREIFAAKERDHHITTAGRLALSRDQFALPPGPEEKRRGIKGRLPIDTLKRARNALARAKQMRLRGEITARQLTAIQHKVNRAFPEIHVSPIED